MKNLCLAFLLMFIVACEENHDNGLKISTTCMEADGGNGGAAGNSGSGIAGESFANEGGNACLSRPIECYRFAGTYSQ